MNSRPINFPDSPLTHTEQNQANDLMHYYSHVMRCSLCRTIFGIDNIPKDLLGVLCTKCNVDLKRNRKTRGHRRL